MITPGGRQSYNLVADKRRTLCTEFFLNIHRKRRYKKLLDEANAAQLAYEKADDALNHYLEHLLDYSIAHAKALRGKR